MEKYILLSVGLFACFSFLGVNSQSFSTNLNNNNNNNQNQNNKRVSPRFVQGNFNPGFNQQNLQIYPSIQYMGEMRNYENKKANELGNGIKRDVMNNRQLAPLPPAGLEQIKIKPIQLQIQKDKNKKPTKNPSILQETMNLLMDRLELDQIENMNFKDVDGCMDKFICETANIVKFNAPALIEPSLWFLKRIWPQELHHKINNFQNIARSPGDRQLNCEIVYKCKIKRLENLFNELVYIVGHKMKGRIEEKIKDKNDKNKNGNRFDLSSIFSIIFDR